MSDPEINEEVAAAEAAEETGQPAQLDAPVSINADVLENIPVTISIEGLF